MKKILVAVISCQDYPYGDMIGTSMNTWDSVHVEGCETLFYCGLPQKQNTDKIVYFNIKESLHSMGFKDLLFFEYALTKEWDYMARVNSSCWVHKKELTEYCQTLPDTNVFAGLKVAVEPPWMFGGGQFLMSRDVIQAIVDNKHLWDHRLMEDMAMSYVINQLGIPYTQGNAVSLDNMTSGLKRCTVYGNAEGYDFKDWDEFKKLKGQYFYRVKVDGHRHMEPEIMRKLNEILL
jgi:hypothetical protein